MPLTYNESTATGVTTAGSALGTDFPIYFPYLAKSHINADFNKVLQSQSNFTVYDANEAVVPAGAFGASTAFIRFTVGYPTIGTTVRVRRITEKAFPLVDFQDGSALTADDQDLAFLQNFYLNQESVEQADNALGKVGTVFYANSVRITEVGQPTANNDATTKLYVDTQDALKVAKAGDTMSGALAMGTNKITGLGTPTANTDAATKAYVDSGDTSLNTAKVAKAGDTMSGALAMGSNKITGLGTPSASTDASTKAYVDSGDALKVSKAGDSMSGTLDMNFNRIIEVGTPTAGTDAATKDYADTKLSLSGGTMIGSINANANVVTGIPDPVNLADAASKSYVDSSIQQYISTGGVSGNPTRWQHTGNGTTTVFNISGATAIYTNCYLVAIDGVVQDPTYSYTVSVASQTLTFDEAPPSGSRIVIITLGYALPTISSIPNNTVSTGSIVDLNVTTAKIADSAITSAKIADGTIATTDIANNAVTDAKLSSSATVDAARAVTTDHIRDSAVTLAKLASNSVNNTKIIDASVSSSKIADSAVITAKLDSLGVTTAKIADLNVTTGKLADSAVTAAKIADSTITSGKLATSGVTSGSYGSTTNSVSITVNDRGLITSASNQAIAFPPDKIVNVTNTIKTDSFAGSNTWGIVPIGFGGTLLEHSLSLVSSSNKVLLSGSLMLGVGAGTTTGLLARIYLARRAANSTSVAATTLGSGTSGRYYRIETLGATQSNFTSIGAASATTGLYFRHNGTAGTGGGTVTEVTMIGQGTQNGTRPSVLGGIQVPTFPVNAIYPYSFEVLDTPSITNPVYTLLIAGSGTSNVWVNRSCTWNDGGGSGSASTANDLAPSSTFTAIEVT